MATVDNDSSVGMLQRCELRTCFRRYVVSFLRASTIVGLGLLIAGLLLFTIYASTYVSANKGFINNGRRRIVARTHTFTTKGNGQNRKRRRTMNTSGLRRLTLIRIRQLGLIVISSKARTKTKRNSFHVQVFLLRRMNVRTNDGNITARII